MGPSILILTKNESANIGACIKSVAWSDDIWVLDSYSTDETPAIATKLGAQIVSREFDDWSSHQNWAIRSLPFKYPWVLYLDADERVTSELAVSVRSALSSPDDHVAFRLRRRDFFMGRWLKRVQITPYYLRLFRPERMRYERLVNPVSIPDGTIGELDGFLNHYPFSKGINQWFERHNQYSSLEALETESQHARLGRLSIRSMIFSQDFHIRRYHQKEFSRRLPARPLLKFLWIYFLKRGFLDGLPGFHYALMQSTYEYMIVLKEVELKSGHIGALRNPVFGAPETEQVSVTNDSVSTVAGHSVNPQK